MSWDKQRTGDNCEFLTKEDFVLHGRKGKKGDKFNINQSMYADDAKGEN